MMLEHELPGCSLTTRMGRTPKCAAENATRRPPRVGDRYQLIRTLARGGMAAVHLARREPDGELVALKLIHDFGQSADERARWCARFVREAKVIGRLRSANVVRLLDTGFDPFTAEPFIAMELLNGEDLGSVFTRAAPLAPDLALRIAGQICFGLHSAHQEGIVHRDLKPGNVFAATEPGGLVRMKLLDFGVAKLLDGAGISHSLQLTQADRAIGTPRYMAPEQLRCLRTLDHRADLWALGILLFRALTGVTPHETANMLDLVIDICSTPAPDVRTRAPWVDARTAALVRGLLAIDPADRPADAMEVFTEILSICGDVRIDVSELTEQARKTDEFPLSEQPTTIFTRG